ncbi:MAG: PPOX class F420-dependent oxidoreductase [Pseudonocardiaceae bacterium]
MNGRTRTGRWVRWYVSTVTLLAGVGMMAAGAWSLAAPHSFAEFVDFPYHEHFLRDLGAFQLGIGATLLLALLWSDALATVLAGFLAGNTIHAVNHTVDLDVGGHVWDAMGLAAVSLLAAVALGLRLRQLGYVVGAVNAATTPTLAPFVRQKTVLLTTYRRDGTPRGTPVSIAVDGDHAFIRSFEKAAKTRRLRRNPMVDIAPSTALGRPTGPALHGHMRRLDGNDSRRAARLLARKHPVLHGLAVPLSHRVLLRRKTGRTVHFALTPADGAIGRCQPTASAAGDAM